MLNQIAVNLIKCIIQKNILITKNVNDQYLNPPECSKAFKYHLCIISLFIHFFNQTGSLDLKIHDKKQ